MKSLIEKYIKTWETRCYHEGIPDDAPVEIFEKVPSYKKIALAILKNDITLLGYNRPTTEYYSMLKRIELKERGVINSEQLNLFQ